MKLMLFFFFKKGALVDRIENQVSTAREYAEEGVQQTKEALEHHRSLIKVFKF